MNFGKNLKWLLITLSGNLNSGFLSFFFFVFSWTSFVGLCPKFYFLFSETNYGLVFSEFFLLHIWSTSWAARLRKLKTCKILVNGVLGSGSQCFQGSFEKTSWIFFSFNFPLAGPRPTLGHYYWGSSLTHPMSITAFLKFTSECHLERCSEVVSLSPVEGLVGFELGTFQF